jgi:hypothetical protein
MANGVNRVLARRSKDGFVHGAVIWYRRNGMRATYSNEKLNAHHRRMSASAPIPDMSMHNNETSLRAIRRHMQCSKL